MYRVYNIDDNRDEYEVAYPCSSQNRRMIIRKSSSFVYRFFHFYCEVCQQSWLSPKFIAKDGCFCRICHRFILPTGIRHCLTPYLGDELAYGKYACTVCSRGWSSYKSKSNCPDQCFVCGTYVFPYYQIPHSVLYDKMYKNGSNGLLRCKQEESCTKPKVVRKMVSIPGIGKPAKHITKKRLYCLNNVVQQHDAVRRQIHLKPCFSEPIINT